MTPALRLALTLAVAAPLAASVAALPDTALAQGRREAAAEQFVQSQGARVLTILNNKTMPLAEKTRTFNAMIDQIADMDRVTDFVLGKYNRTIQPAQKQEFATLFRRFFNNVWQSRLGDYAGERLVVTGSTARSPTDVVVMTRVSGGKLKQPSQVNWRVLKGANGQWRAVDVQIEGVWLAITQQQDFVSTVDNAGGNVSVLINQLRAQVAKQG